MKATLVVMAAGMGSRYGGEKQTDGIGPNGETIMEYSVYDAIQAGFHKIVFIIKPQMEEMMKTRFGSWLSGLKTREGTPVEVAYVFQDFTSVPAFYQVPQERVKPFGTVHAALCSKSEVNEPFALINADDYYGRSAFQTIFEKLNRMEETGEATMVGYLLKNTVSENGTVTRGVCLHEEGNLRALQETFQIKKYPDGRIFDTENPEKEIPLNPETLVSMNFWGFTPWIFEELDRYFEEFLRNLDSEEKKAECLLPMLVDQLIRQGKIQVSVLSTDAVWFGVTYREDRETVAEALRELHKTGEYPESLH